MKVISRILSYAPEKKSYFFMGALLSIISCVLVVLPFYFLHRVLYALIVTKNSYDAIYFGIVVLALLISRVLVYLAALTCTHMLSFRIETNMKKEGIKALMRASFLFFDKNESGRVRKLIDDNTGLTHTIIAHIIPDMIAGIVTPVLLIATIFAVDVKLGIYMVVVTLIGFLIVKFMFGNQEFMKMYMQALDDMNAEAVEYVRGIQVVKIFGASRDTFNRLYEKIRQYAQLAYKYTLSCKYPYVAFQVLFMMFTAFVVPFALEATRDQVSGNEILANVIFFSCFAGMIFQFFMKIMYAGMYHAQGKEAISKFEGIIEQMNEKNTSYGTLEDMESFDISFKNVSFSYDEKRVLDNTSFYLKAGKTYAVVGASGSGKTTIAKLLAGFYKVDEGSIEIGGRDMYLYSERAIRNNIAFVFQQAKLFPVSIYENVRMGDENATYEDVMNALKLASCSDILDKFKDREHTVIGTKGVYLSGGETQRIAVARAILKNAKIVILDEASAAADPENEYEMQRAFKNLMRDKTVIMIAHRLSSIKQVDEILVVDKGDIIERGSHEELMSKGGKYRQLQELYTKANEWRVMV